MPKVRIVHLYPQRDIMNGGTEYVVHFLEAGGDEVSVVSPIDGSMVVIDGYEIAEAGDDLAETDTVNEALAKLEARVAALELP